MEPVPNGDTANLGCEKGKIGDNVYVHAGNDDENPDVQSTATPIIPQEINIPELPSPKVRDISYFEQNEAKFDEGYDSKGHSGPYVPPLVENVNEEEENIGDDIPERYATVDATKPPAANKSKKDSSTNEIIGVIVGIDENIMNGMSGKALKGELKCQMLPISGIKAVLLTRLILGIAEKKPKYILRNATFKHK